ncbi:MAG: PDZ domain-containing protein, partial [Dokdonella sp.]
GMLSPDGKTFVYTPIDRDFRSWKRYRGGRAQDVWTYDLSANTSKRLTDDPASDNQPLWVGDTIYFTSDRNYTVNLFSMSPNGGEAKQLTHFTDFDVLWPSAGKNAIVFENGGAIWRFDPATEQATQVPIRVSGDYAQTVPQWKNVVEQVESFDVDAAGKTILFGARGDIFRYDIPRKESRNLSLTPSERELGVILSPDAKMVAYLSDATGEYEIWLRPVAGGEARRVTRDGGIWRFPPQFAPDGKHIAYADKQQRLRVVDVASGITTDVDQGKFDDITEYRWSPDGQWLAYTAEDGNGLTRVWLHSLKAGKHWPITEATSSAYSPTFDPQGRWLYFLSNRDFNLQFSAYEENYLYTNGTRIYAVSLASDGPVLYREPDGDKPDATLSAKKPNDKPVKLEPLRIDPEGMVARVQALKAPAGNYPALQAGVADLFYLQGGGRGNGGMELKMIGIDSEKEVTLVKGVSGFQVIGEGKQVLARQGDKFAVLDAKAEQDFAKATLDLSQMQMLVDPQLEWKQEFTDAWRILRDWFYDPGLHGGIERWNTVRVRYAALVPYVASRQDLDYLLQELVGEANSGHVYVQQGDQPKIERRAGGLLGAQMEATPSGYFRIAKIYPGENWDKASRSPLTEAGVSVKEGDYIIAVDGVDARSVKNFYQLLQNKGDRMVSLRVNGSAGESGAREERVRTITSEQKLRYRDWVDARRAMVDRLSNGRIGYIHVPNTSQEGNKELFRGLLAYRNKDALIIDDRYNGGGFIPDRMIELLARQPLNYWKRRGLDPAPTPLLSHPGPKAMLINGLSSSGGDAFPYYFRKLGLGKIIGTRTWGGLIGISGNPGLADGGSVLASTFRFMDTDGKWAVENEGVSPDIEVIDRPELLAAGRDPSIEKAVEVLMQELATKTFVAPKAPHAPTDFGNPEASQAH